MVLVELVVCMQKNANRSIFITLHITQLQVDQIQHKTNIEPGRRKNYLGQLIVIGDKFLNRTPIVQVLRSTNNKWDLMNLNRLYKAKDSVNNTKLQSTKWENIFKNSTFKTKLQLEAAHSFLATITRNNHTETILIATLFGQ